MQYLQHLMELNIEFPYYNYSFNYNFCGEPYETGRRNTKGWPSDDKLRAALFVHPIEPLQKLSKRLPFQNNGAQIVLPHFMRLFLCEIVPLHYNLVNCK